MTSYGQFITHTAVQTPDVGGSSSLCKCDLKQSHCVLIPVRKDWNIYTCKNRFELDKV